MITFNNSDEKIELLRSRNGSFLQREESQPFSGNFYYESPCFDIDRATVSHTILGFGVSMTDASCYLIHGMPAAAREQLLDELFSPEKLALSIVRLNVGSSDYATRVYSYDDGEEDPELKNFSIEHDHKWIIPTMKQLLELRPDIFVYSSPWSPPGWMKTGGSMCGGYMRAKYLPAFADYMVKYLLAYRECGIDIHAVTMQNEAETDQRGTMPQSLLHPDFEMELVGRLMPPRLAAAGLKTKMWLHDHNYNAVKRVFYMLSDPDVARNTDAVAFHPYSGSPAMMRPLREAFPQIKFHQSEKSPNNNPGSPESRIAWWCNTILDNLNNGCSSFMGWNCVLNEKGAPNLGNFKCSGLVELHSVTGEIKPDLQYYAFAHISPYVHKDAEVLNAPADTPLPDKVSCGIFRNPDSSLCAVIGNDNATAKTIQFKYRNRYLKVYLPDQSMTTLFLDK